ncbi:MAG TPA: nitroreductase family deazaflavin-dependent oxidoreductase [Actinomycetota bacterium]|nr:nitroreductase family deazaflavin-dependent oxidoreductase [Actinomycetota bacterium]
MMNGMVRALLRSPAHGLASGAIALLTVWGRRSGRSYELPVQYVERDGGLIVLAGHAGTKTWWRNLRTPAPVRVRLRGQDVDGTAVVIAGRAEAAEALRTYVGRFPKSRRSLSPSAAAETGDGDLEHVFVRIDLGSQGPASGASVSSDWEHDTIPPSEL